MPYDRDLPYNALPLLPPPEQQIITIETLQAVNKANKALAELKGLAKKLLEKETLTAEELPRPTPPPEAEAA